MRQSHSFTFVEILVAALVLSMAVAMVVAILGAARARILRAERAWGREHLLANASEFFLLAGKDGSLPEDVLPEGYSARCELSPAEDLPESAQEGIQGWAGWRLGRFVVSVTDSSGRTLGERLVEKVVREDDCY